MSSPKVNDTIDEYAFNDFKQQYHSINDALQKVRPIIDSFALEYSLLTNNANSFPLDLTEINNV